MPTNDAQVSMREISPSDMKAWLDRAGEFMKRAEGIGVEREVSGLSAESLMFRLTPMSDTDGDRLLDGREHREVQK